MIYKTIFFKKIGFFVSICCTFILGPYFGNFGYVYAYDPACVGPGVGKYIQDFFVALGGRPAGAKFLSPAFNLSEPNFKTLYQSVKASAGSSWANLDGIAGNVYNDGGPWLGYSDPVLARIYNLRVNVDPGFNSLVITETGPKHDEWTLPDGFIKLANDAAGGKLIGAMFFNGFCTGYGWTSYCLTSSELTRFCSTGDCGKLGGNSAREYWTPDLYTKVKSAGYGWTLEIAPLDGKLDPVIAGVKAAHTNNLKPIVRIGYGVCDDNRVGVFSDPAKYAQFVKAVIAQTGGEVWFIVGPNEPDVEQWASPGCGCSASDGGPGNFVEVKEPDCPATPYKLTIKGVIKSSLPFVQSTDAMTGETIFTDARTVSGVAGSMPYITNVPINGATIQLHDSQKLDKYGDHINSPGMVDGMLKQAYKTVKTKPDGTFTIEAQSHCGKGGNVYRSDWRGTGYEQYLSVSCPDKVKGELIPRMVIKDVLGYVLDLHGTGKEIEVVLPEINVDCQPVPWKTYPGVAITKAMLDFAPRSKEVFMACSGANRITSDGSGLAVSKIQPWDFDLIFKDRWGEGTPLALLANLLDLLSRIITGDDSCVGGSKEAHENCWGDWLRKHVPFDGRTEVRTADQTTMYSLDEHAILIDTLLGTRGGKLEDSGAIPVPNYYLTSAPAGVETWNGHEGKQVLVDCESFKRCSSTLSKEAYPLDNSQTCGGMWNNMAPPFGGIVRKANGEIDINLSGDLIRYKNLPKDREVCKGRTGEVVTVRDIMPLPGYCGDLDNNGAVGGEALGEMPCPQAFSCGDLDDDGVVDSAKGEKECMGASGLKMESTTPGDYSVTSTYKYDIRYFPYSMLYNTDTDNLSEATTESTRTENDSYKQDSVPRGSKPDNAYVATEDGSGQSKPGVKGTLPLTFFSEAKTKYPCTNEVCFKKHENLETTDMSSVNPVPVTMLGSPANVTATDSRELVERSIEEISRTVTLSDKGHFFRLGIPQDLCTCSLVEDGSNTKVPSLKNCVQTDANVLGGGVPQTTNPGNLFTPVRDQMVGGDSHLAGDFPGVDFNNPDNADKVAGGADWEGLKDGVVVDKVKTKDSDRYKHYEQDTSLQGSFLDDLVETAKCVFNSHTVNEVTQQGEGGTDCGRELRKVAKNVGLGQTLPDLLKNKLALLNALDTPVIVQQQVAIQSAGLKDRTMTKPERLADGNPYGFDSSQSNTTSTTRVPGSQGSSYIVNYGYSGLPRYKFVNSVSSPVFSGQETPVCRMVPGWQVEEMGTFPDGEGLFTVDCLEDASKCWVGGAVKNEDWGGAKSLIMSGTPSSSGINWTSELNKSGGFVHGLSAYTGGNIATVGNITYNSFNGSWSPMAGAMKMLQPRADSTNTSTNYTGFLYDVAGGLGGYIATGTGHVFYSSDGKSNWNVISKKDSVTGLTGCESPDWPYGCKTYKCNPTTGVCTDCNADGSGGKPRCCCKGYSADPLADADGNPLTPNCPDGARGTPNECWLWEDSSIWGVDCNNATGDCIVAGQSGAHVWSAPSSGLGNADNWRRVNLGGGHAMNVSFPGGLKNVAYVVGASGNGCDAAGGFIKKSEDGGITWNAVVTQPGSESGYRGIDCFDADHCAIAGTHGIVKITEDGGRTWKDWEELWPDDEIIQEAKTNGVRFWDVAYPNENTLVAVGFKPESHTPEASEACDSNPAGDEVIGVIYTLGEREDCEEILKCGGSSGASFSDGATACFAYGTAEWNNSNSVNIEGSQVDPSYGLGGNDTVRVTGTIKARDPITFKSSTELVYSACTLGRSCHNWIAEPANKVAAVPTIRIKYNGQENVYQLNAEEVGNTCGYVSDIKINLIIPNKSEVWIDSNPRTKHNWGSPCLGSMQEYRVVDGSFCVNGYAWSATHGCVDPSCERCGQVGKGVCGNFNGVYPTSFTDCL